MKKKIVRKIFATLLTLALVATTVLAFDQEVLAFQKGTWGNLSWSQSEDGVLTITGNGDMPDCPNTGGSGADAKYKQPWYDSDGITKVVIGEGVTSIGSYNFFKDRNIEEVVLSSTVRHIRPHAFDTCTGLRKVDTSQAKDLTTVGVGAFWDCKKLDNCWLPDSVQLIGDRAFENCAFTEFYFPTSLKRVSTRMLAGNTKLGPLNIPEHITSVGDKALAGCKMSGVAIRNKNCKIANFTETFPAGARIFGHKGSTAQTYAKRFKRLFQDFDGKVTDYRKSSSSSSSATVSGKKVKAKKIKIVGAPRALKAGKSARLKVKFTPTGVTTKSLTWKTSNKRYATVNSKGKVVAKKAGRGKKVKITAVTRDGSKKKYTVVIKIKK